MKVARQQLESSAVGGRDGRCERPDGAESGVGPAVDHQTVIDPDADAVADSGVNPIGAVGQPRLAGGEQS